MKKQFSLFRILFILILLTLFTFRKGYSQQNPPQKVNANYQFKSAGADSSQRLPKSKASNANFKDSGMIWFNKTDDKIHLLYTLLRDTTWPNLSEIFGSEDTNIVIGVGTNRFSALPPGTQGVDLLGGWIADADHKVYVISSYINSQTFGYTFYWPTMDTVSFAATIEDETLSGLDIRSGVKMFNDSGTSSVYFPVVSTGFQATGTGTGNATYANTGSAWTPTYDEGLGFGRLQAYYSAFGQIGRGQYDGMACIYAGNRRNCRCAISYSGLTGNNKFAAFLIDSTGSFVTRWGTGDFVYLTGQGMVNPIDISLQTYNTSTAPQFSTSNFCNWWALIVGVKDRYDPPPPPPGSMSAVAGGSAGQIVLTWPSLNNATQYIVKHSIHPNYGFTTIYTGSNLTFTDTGLTTGTVYYYIIQAQNTSRPLVGGLTVLNNGWWNLFHDTWNNTGVTAP